MSENNKKKRDREKPDDPVVYVAIDCEASGHVPGLFNLVSLAAVPVRAENGRHVVGDDLFYVELKPVFPGFSREAMAIHGLTRKHLSEHGLEPKKAMRKLRDWALSLKRDAKERLVFVGHNAPFDWSFIAYYFAWAKLENPFGYKALDTKALAMGKLDIPWLGTNKDVLSARLPGLKEEDRSQKHRADYDARFQAEILAALLDYRR